VGCTLGLETSCDETSAALVDPEGWILGQVVASQHDLHARYGGVVPEIASRAHLERIAPVLEQALVQAELDYDAIDLVAVGHRPGLVGSLLVGVSAAKAISWILDRPLVGVDHVAAHLYAPALAERDGAAQNPAPIPFPALGMVLSGGHTTLYDVRGPDRLHALGRSIDDAVGEAFDKAAAGLGLGQPGGPAIERVAREGRAEAVEPLPRTLLGRDSLDFSFSGLKTALLYRVRGQPEGRGRHARFPRSAEDLTPAG
jgi:N6-L-threonylcarbamoyladenine synthase